MNNNTCVAGATDMVFYQREGCAVSLPYEKYNSGDYLTNNISWHNEDSPWKAKCVFELLKDNNVSPQSICEVGCGAGGVLGELRNVMPHVELTGYDIASDATKFWGQYQNRNIDFQLGDFFILNMKTYDVILVLDVVEHVHNPFDFIHKLKGAANYYLFHFPLDLCALTVLRERPILLAREKVGHINYFTKNLAISLIKECGLEIVDWKYSGAGLNLPNRQLKTILAAFPRRLGYVLNKDLAVRALGGETLYILAKC